MNTKQFQLVKGYVGTDLLNYILNCDHITWKSDYENLELQSVQVEVLDDLHAKIQECRILFIEQGGFGDGVDFYLRRITLNGTSLFNHYRQFCGGQLASPTSTDPLISYLQQVCIREYPNLLIKSSGTSYWSVWTGMGLEENEYEKFIYLIKNDVLDQITNKKDEPHYAFQFSTTDGLEFNSHVFSARISVITRSFYDSCNRMDYSLTSVLKDIDKNVDLMRRLANGEQITYSSFIGIRGLQFQGFRTIDLPDGVLRQFRDEANPGIHTNRTVVEHPGNIAGEYSGHVFEVFHFTKITSTTGTTNTGNSVESNRVQENALQKLRFAVVFSSFANRGPAPTFFENGFPLLIPGGYSSPDGTPGDYILIDEATKTKLVEWYNVLNNKDLKRVQTSLNRLQYAIFERSNPEDAIVDAIIAWEGMFSEAFETTFKVTGSMAKFLRPSSERDKFYRRLKKLYNLRSELVHGGTSKSLKNENIQDVRAEVINIGLECLMKIIRDDRLLSLSSTDRIKTILVLDEPDTTSILHDAELDAPADLD